MGNNHAGTYHPVVLSVIPDLALVLQNDELFWPRHATLNVLIELCGSFEPEHPGGKDEAKRLAKALLAQTALMLPLLLVIAEEEDVLGQSARDLIEILADS